MWAWTDIEFEKIQPYASAQTSCMLPVFSIIRVPTALLDVQNAWWSISNSSSPFGFNNSTVSGDSTFLASAVFVGATTLHNFFQCRIDLECQNVKLTSVPLAMGDG
ncbi:hypothetical protein MPER_01416 [Moniliophthora perniciosa FA553]|nr:hypothetical protein MPER_01416 [Moniliophthora perniciosa FA553]